MSQIVEADEPLPEQADRSALLNFLSADVRGYTRFTVEQGDESTARLANRLAELSDQVLAAHNGRVIELRGDEALAAYQECGDQLGIGIMLMRLAVEAKRVGDRHGAQPLLEESLRLHRRVGFSKGEAQEFTFLSGFELADGREDRVFELMVWGAIEAEEERALVACPERFDALVDSGGTSRRYRW